MRNYKGIISYDGTHYLGWQKTRMGPSIEEELEKALSTLLRHPVQLQAASRTDAGVHAKGQVINFFTHVDIDFYRFSKGINALLPQDIRLLSLEEMPQDFHPTLTALGKEYVYEICSSTIQSPFFRDRSWHFPYKLNLEDMREAVKTLLGTHDFSSFCNDRNLIERDPICTLHSIDIEETSNHHVRIIVQGNRFLYKMMRNLAGTIAYTGCGKITADSLSDILLSRQRSLAGMTAPAHGLYLQRVLYSL